MNELIALALRRAGVNTLAEFQALQGLPQTGEADPETQLALEPYLLGFRTIRIQPGDTYWELAARYGTTSQAIATANPSLDPERLPVGAPMRVPLGFPVVPTDVPMTSNLCSLCIRGLVGRYPGLCRMEALTTTAFGRPVEALTMGSGQRRVLYTAAHHANEWITATLLLAFAEDLAKAAIAGAVIGGYPGRELLEVATIHMVPMVDPDGVDLVTGALPADSGDYAFARSLASYYPSIPFPNGWKANLLGIDLNLNYPAGWETAREIKFEQGFTRPGPRDYVGRAPLDQRETQALARYTQTLNPALVLAYHSQGEVIYWQFQDIYVPGARELGEKLKHLRQVVEEEQEHELNADGFLQLGKGGGHGPQIPDGPAHLGLGQAQTEVVIGLQQDALRLHQPLAQGPVGGLAKVAAFGVLQMGPACGQGDFHIGDGCAGEDPQVGLFPEMGENQPLPGECL